MSESQYKIVTNNPNVKEIQENIIFVEGGFKEVLLRVRDFVHMGHELISHPLGASLRMLFSPYRSIIIGSQTETANDIYVETIENSLANYKKHMEVRNPDTANRDDYALIDSELLNSALLEHKRLNNL